MLGYIQGKVEKIGRDYLYIKEQDYPVLYQIASEKTKTLKVGDNVSIFAKIIPTTIKDRYGQERNSYKIIELNNEQEIPICQIGDSMSSLKINDNTDYPNIEISLKGRANAISRLEYNSHEDNYSSILWKNNEDEASSVIKI